MQFLIYVAEDKEPILIGPVEDPITKLLDYIEVGYLSGKRISLTAAEIAVINRDGVYYLDGLHGWHIVTPRKPL